jgi:hypothetical protein
VRGLARSRERHHALCTGAQRHTAASPAYERGLGPAAPKSELTIERNERAAAKARRTYERTMRAVPTVSAEALLIAVCIENRDPRSSRPGDATQSAPNPAVEGLQLVPLTEAEVAGPSPLELRSSSRRRTTR